MEAENADDESKLEVSWEFFAEMAYAKRVKVVYKKAYDTSRARRTRLRRIYPNQNHNKHHTPGIIVYINE